MSPTINSSLGSREWLLLITLSVLWGGSFFLIEIVVTALTPLTIVLLRVTLAAGVLWSYAIVRGLKPPSDLAIYQAFAVMGLLNNVVPFSLIVWGQTRIDSGLASILNATTPLFAVIVAGLLLTDERMTALKLVGAATGFAGVVIMIGPDVLTGVGADVLAQLAVLGAALCYAFAGVFGRRFRTLGVDPVITAAGQVSASALILLPVTLIIDQPFQQPMPGIGVWLAVIALAVLSTALAYILYFRLLATAGATNLLLVTFLIPVSALLLGTTVLGETLAPLQLVGMSLIGIGLSAIDGRLWRRRP